MITVPVEKTDDGPYATATERIVGVKVRGDAQYMADVFGPVCFLAAWNGGFTFGSTFA